MGEDARTAADTVTAVMRPGRVVLVGELHGTRELPALVARVATQVAGRCPVAVGLEIPVGAIAQPGSSFWTRPPQHQDGRSSTAMARLVEQLRPMEPGIRLFSMSGDPSSQLARDQAMASEIVAALTRHPDTAVLVLAGSAHTRTAPIDGRFGFIPMGWHLRNRGVDVTSVVAVPSGGSYWAVTTPTGAGQVNMVEPTPTLLIKEHDLILDVGAVTASPPGPHDAGRPAGGGPSNVTGR